MKRRSDYKDRDTKTGRVSQRTTKKLEDSKEVDENSKRSYKEVI